VAPARYGPGATFAFRPEAQYLLSVLN